MLDACVRVTAMLAGVESCLIWLWNEDIEAFEYGAGYGLTLPEGDVPYIGLRFFAGAWHALDLLRSGKSPHVSGQDDLNVPPLVRQICPGDTIALLPMINKGQVFGVLSVSFERSRMPNLTDRRLTMLGGVAHQVAAAVDNSRLTAAREEEVWISALMLQVSDLIRRLQPVDETLQQVARLVPILTGVDRCASC